MACRNCKKQFPIEVNIEDYKKYVNGEGLAQDCFPYLSADEREMLISFTCGKCFDEIFKDVE